MTRRTRLELTRFEDRVTPVTGSFDPPFVLNPGDTFGAGNNFEGLGTSVNGSEGLLIDRGPSTNGVAAGSRFLLTSGSNAPAVGSLIDFRLARADGTIQTFSIPVERVTLNNTAGGLPGGPGNLAVVTLAAIAPYGATAFGYYTTALVASTPEPGKPVITFSRDASGTGTSGRAATGTQLRELQRLTITATGGTFQLRQSASPSAATASQLINPLLTPAQVASDLTTALGQLGYAGATVTPVTVGPSAGSYEVLLPASAGNALLLDYNPRPTGGPPLENNGQPGTVAFRTVLDGGLVEYQRLRVTATGGTYTLSFGPYTTAALPAGASAAQIQNALAALLGVGEVTVRPVTSGPGAGSFEIQFDSLTVDQPLLVADSTNLTGGTAAVTSLSDGGTGALRLGSNEIDLAVAGTDTVRIDMDSDGTDSLGVGSSEYLIDVGGGKYAIAAVGNGGGTTTFGSVFLPVRVSTYAAWIASVTEPTTPNLPQITLDMAYQLAGDDSLPNTFTVREVAGRIEVTVQNGSGPAQLYYADSITKLSSLRILGSSDQDTLVIDPSVTTLVTFDGRFGIDTLVGPTLATNWTISGAGAGVASSAPSATTFSNVENLVGRDGNDVFSFAAGGSIAGTLNGGFGTDTIDTSGLAATTVVFGLPGSGGYAGTATPVAGGFTNIDAFNGSSAGTGDVMVTPDLPGVFTHTGNIGTYVNLITNQTIGYANVDVLTGGGDADTFNVRSLTMPLTINGGAGDDAVTVASDAPAAGADRGAVTGSLLVLGGDGFDTFRFNGTAADETVTARVAGPNTGDVLGLGLPAGVTVGFATLENFLFDGRGGANTFTALDVSNTSLGTPTDPGSGIVYAPTSATGGRARINGVAVGGTALGLFTVNGDPDNSGDRDVLTVVGTSAPGLVSAYGEAVVGDGRDRITVTDAAVGIQSALVGGLLPVQIGYTNGFQTFDTLYVAGGNERGNEGDTIVLNTSLTFNLVADGMLPSPSVRPGDLVVINTPGGYDAALVTDPSLGPTQTRVTARADGSSAGLVGFESGAPAVPGAGMLAVGSDAGYPSTVRVFDRATGFFRYEVNPFPGFSDGVKVASGDVNADGIADLVVGAGPNGGPRVAVYDGLTGAQLYDFFGYEDSFRGGVTVAVGDVDQDGYGDLILGTGVGGGPRVRVLSGKDLTPLRDVLVYESSFRGGVSVAAGDVNGDGVPDLITSAGSGGGPRVVVVDGRTSTPLASFFVFDPNSRTGFTAAGGDVNGDGFADIVVGAGATAPAQVRVFSGFNRAVLNDFYINDPFNPGLRSSPIGAGVRVAVSDADGDGVGDIITGLGPGGDAVVRTYKVTGVNQQTNALFPTLAEIRRQDAFDVGYNFGIFVGAAD